MAQYHIHHATGQHRFEEVIKQPRVYAGFVEANSLEEAYMKAQNAEEAWNIVNPCRSTSVGDIIQDNEHFYMVKGTGFECLTA